MRKLMYRVRRADGTEFHTPSYAEAKAEGNRIKETYLVPVEKEKPKFRKK